MSAQEKLKRNKTQIIDVLCGDHTLILNKTEQKALITKREYNNLKSINKADVGDHVVALVDKIMNKGETTCQNFLDLLQTDEDIKTTFPELENLQLGGVLRTPVQATSPCCGDMMPAAKRQKTEEVYELRSQPVGLCLIINNESFRHLKERRGTNKDAESLAEVFSWLGFRVLMCKDKTGEEMQQTLEIFASARDPVLPQELDVQEWLKIWRNAPLQHGDAFVCCILTHGAVGQVLGIDSQPLAIKEIRRHFKATDQSALTGKPKVFLIQACQGTQNQTGVLERDMEEDSSSSVPQEADILVAVSTVEDYVSLRHPVDGSWFIQSVCEQLREHCPSGEEITSILHRVHYQVGQKEANFHNNPNPVKQAPELRSTLRKRLVLTPR